MVNEKEVLYTFNRELCERLELSGMTYRDLAFKARCAPSRVESYLRGNNFPNLWTLTLMAEALDCCIDDLLGYKNRRNGYVLIPHSKNSLANSILHYILKSV